MYFEITSKRNIVDQKGNDKMISERFLVDNCELFAQAEMKGYELYNNENDITAIKQSAIREFVNVRETEEQSVYLATIVDVYVDDNGNEKEMKYIVGVFATSVDNATKLCLDYLKQGMSDFILVGIKRSKILDII